MLNYLSNTAMKAFLCLCYTHKSVYYLLFVFQSSSFQSVMVTVNYLNDHIKFKVPQSDDSLKRSISSRPLSHLVGKDLTLMAMTKANYNRFQEIGQIRW